MSACFDPLLHHVDERRLITDGQTMKARFVLVKTGRSTWPLTREQAAELVERLEASGRHEKVFERVGFAFFERSGGVRKP
jgi:hypothetical protein